MNNLDLLSEEQQLQRAEALSRALAKKLHSALSYAGLIDAHVTGINRNYDIHYHTFSPDSYAHMLQHFCKHAGTKLELVGVNPALAECIGIIRKERNGPFRLPALWLREKVQNAFNVRSAD